jgi:preprotein translocase subunit SecG
LAFARGTLVPRVATGEREAVLLYILTGLYIVTCLLLLLVILLQQGRGGDIAAAFGGSSSQAAFGARSGATLLTRVTTVLAVLFMLGSLGLAIVRHRGPQSVVSGSGPAPRSAPASTAPAKPATPTSQTPAPAQQTPAQKPPATPAQK